MSKVTDDDEPAEVVVVDELRARRERPIVPAGMSYQRALQIAIAALDPDADRVDWFARDEVLRLLRSF